MAHIAPVTTLLAVWVLTLGSCASTPQRVGSTPAAPASVPSTPFLHAPSAPTAPLAPEQIDAAARYSEAFSGRAFLVLQNGTVVAERYTDGWAADRPHALASGTKSFTGAVAAAALADGIITSLDEPVSDTITEWKSDLRKAAITVRQLLTLTSGLEPDSALLGRQGAGIKDLGGASDLGTRLRGGARETMPNDRFAAALQVPAARAPGTTFEYGPTHFYAFGAFMERALQKANRPEKTHWEYLQARVLAPAGIAVSIDRFAPDAGRKPNLPGGGHLTAREWAGFGEFIRRGGAAVAWAAGDTVAPTGTQAIPTERLALCFEPSTVNPNYGLTWWLLNGQAGQGPQAADGANRRLLRRPARQAAQTAAIRDADGAVIPLAMAAGAGKQRLYILPEHGLVVVRFAEMNSKGAAFNDGEFIRALLGVTPAAKPAANAAADPAATSTAPQP